ncbi:MAG: S8 family serine peptidase [Planctomycetaceae bacterium]|nr:S8 family serine peptidase [Planctomycetaceae bacterium]
MLTAAVLSALLALPAPPAAEAPRRAVWVSMAGKAIPKGGVRPEHTPLTPRALERRARLRTDKGLVDARDLPIDPARVAGVLATGATYRTQSRWLNAVSVEASDAELRAIMRLPFVRTAWPLHASQPDAPDASSPVEGGIAGGAYGSMESQLLQIDIPSLHARGFHGEGMVIGVLDTGFRRVHEAFNSAEHPLSVIAEWDFVSNDGNTDIETGDDPNQHKHGTWILGTLAAYKPGSAVGAAYAARFILAKTEAYATETVVEEDYYAAGLEFIEMHGADIATSSLGYIDWYLPEDLDGQTAITTQAVNIATANGLVCLTAAGNQGHDSDPATNHLVAPSDALSVIACGAADIAGATASFSSDGPSADGRIKPEVLACGVAVATVHSTNTTGYSAVSGTSLSTPLVAGAAALILQARRDYGVASIRSALCETASDFALSGTHDPLFVRGFGVISAFDAAKKNRAAEDLNLDGAVNAQDLATLLSTWGSCNDPDPSTGYCISDLTLDGITDAADLARLLGNWTG